MVVYVLLKLHSFYLSHEMYLELPAKLHAMGLTIGVYGDLLNYEEIRQKMRDSKCDIVIYDRINEINQ